MLTPITNISARRALHLMLRVSPCGSPTWIAVESFWLSQGWDMYTKLMHLANADISCVLLSVETCHRVNRESLC